MPKEAEAKAKAEFNKLKMMSPMSAEASVLRGYIDWMVNVPWSKKSKVRHDLKQAEALGISVNKSVKEEVCTNN